MRIAVGSLKGGVAKTTTAIFLALGLAKNGRVLLIDADIEQSSAFTWSEAAGDDWPTNCVCVHMATRRLYERVEQMSGDYDHLIIDTGPKNPMILRQAMALADRLIVPAAPRPLDLAELPVTFELAAEVASTRPQLLAAALLTMVRPGTRSAGDARELLADMDVPVMRSQVRLRESFSLAYGAAPTDLADYSDVLGELEETWPTGA